MININNRSNRFNFLQIFIQPPRNQRLASLASASLSGLPKPKNFHIFTVTMGEV